MYKTDIIPFIPFGVENAIHLQELADITNLSPRDSKNEVNRLRNAGAWNLCSSERGYWLTEYEHEAKMCIDGIMKQGLTSIKTANNMLYAMPDCDDARQMKLILKDSEEI